MSQLKSYFFRKVLPNYAKSPSWALLYRAVRVLISHLPMSLFNYYLSSTRLKVPGQFKCLLLFTTVTLGPNTIPSTQEILSKCL